MNLSEVNNVLRRYFYDEASLPKIYTCSLSDIDSTEPNEDGDYIKRIYDFGSNSFYLKVVTIENSYSGDEDIVDISFVKPKEVKITNFEEV